MTWHNYVVAHMEFQGLPSKLGIFTERNLIDKIWQTVTANITYVHCQGNTFPKIISSGQVTNVEFDQFLVENNIQKIVYTTTRQLYYYNAILVSNNRKTIYLYDQYILDISLIEAKIVKESTFFSTHFKQSNMTILEYLQKYSPLACNHLSQLNWDKYIKKLNKPVCKAEYLHSKYNHLPDPIQWVMMDYQPEEVNEYTEFMSKFNFASYKNSTINDIYKLIKKLNY